MLYIKVYPVGWRLFTRPKGSTLNINANSGNNFKNIYARESDSANLWMHQLFTWLQY
jgi:hypothetical protein